MIYIVSSILPPLGLCLSGWRHPPPPPPPPPTPLHSIHSCSKSSSSHLGPETGYPVWGRFMGLLSSSIQIQVTSRQLHSSAFCKQEFLRSSVGLCIVRGTDIVVKQYVYICMYVCVCVCVCVCVYIYIYICHQTAVCRNLPEHKKSTHLKAEFNLNYI